jgi:hypothetical protein
MIRLKQKNEQIKELKLIFRQSSKQTLIQIENILQDVSDKKAFIFLLDAQETEKEITREIIENLIDKTTELNSELIDLIEKKYNSSISNILNEIFSPQNFKSLLIAAVVFGLLLSISTHGDVSLRILDIFNISGTPSTVKTQITNG